MKDFVRLELKSKYDRKKFFETLSVTLPEYTWRTGGGDYQEPYVSGISNGEQIKVCMTDPVEVSISFRSEQERNMEYKVLRFEAIKNELSKLGYVSNIQDVD